MTDSVDPGVPRPLVVVVDLRTEYDTVLAARRFADVQTAYARTRVPAGTRNVDADRVLVLDSVEELVAHRQAYERIFAGMYSKVVCVAVGAPVDGSIVLRRPGQLAGSDAATLWVGDVRGTDWAPGRAPGVTLSPDDADALAPLVDVLTQPEVFDHVLAGVTEMPRSIAAPGMTAFVQRIRDDAVQRARIRAVQRLSGAEGGVDEPWPEPLAALADDQGPGPVAAGGMRECVRADSPLGGRWAHADQGLGHAQRRLSLLAGPLALYGSAGHDGRPIHEQVADAATALLEYRDLVRQTVGRGAAGLDADGRAWLDQVGVLIPEPPGVGATSVAGALYERTAAAFDRPEGLRGLAERLRELADRIAPGAGASRAHEVDRTCSDAFLGHYLRPAAFPLGPGHVGVVGAALVGSFLTALWPAFGVVGAGLAVLLAVLGSTLITVRRPDRAGRATLPGEALPMIVVAGLVALVGAVCGLLAGRAWDPPTGVGPLALVLGLAVLVVLPGVDWTVRVRRWERALALGAATRALHALHALLVRTVWNDWALAGPRREAVDRATVLAALLEESAKTLAEDAAVIERQLTGEPVGPDPGAPAFGTAGYPTSGRPAPPSAPPPSAGASLYDTVLADLVDGLHAAFEPLWPLLERDPAEASRRGAQPELRPVLRAYADHLAHNGVQAAPPFARRAQDRPHVGDTAGGDAERIAELLGQPADRSMLQLCGADQLVLLDHAPAHTRSVRFAPRGVRPAVREALRDRGSGHLIEHELVWTGGGRMAGVLRLMPLLPGSVDDARMWEESADGAPTRDLGGPGARHDDDGWAS
ncbi:hypothetical protein OG948_09360 [Embleya sp. NBC_00888]|uniref:hypothetical protein n=1 Tax=Embleya sp. NBC_00888 TaxID=2975960 RepID=UPI0038694409|nr:hypothetical protein OG948_09360 [Embleya sp. NBC_00888]